MGKAVKGVTGGISNIVRKPLDPKSWTSAISNTGQGFIDDIRGGKPGEFFQARDPIAADIFDTQKQALAGQRESLDRYKKMLSEDFADSIAKNTRFDVSRQITGLGGAARDAASRLNETLAQRGVGTSSIGLGASKSIFEDAARKSNLLRASVPGLIRQGVEDERNRRLGAFSDASNRVLSTLNVPVQMRDIRMPIEGAPGLLPGLLGVVGGAIGGKLGGSQGAGVGAGLGTSLGSAFSRR